MSRKVLILNVTRMGDLIQTGPLIARLRYEWPGVEVDLVVDRQFEPVARLLDGVRHAHAYDFSRLGHECRVMSRDVVELYRQVKAWAAPLLDERYDRLVNLTFTRRSGLLASYLQIPDVRGVVSAPDGSTSIRNPWLAYFTDLHHYRRFNRFNLVDLYALGGSGVGPHAPLSLAITKEARDWADECLGAGRPPHGWLAIQIGASEVIKAWRPAYFGQVMADLSRRTPIGFVLIGTESERPMVREALMVYRQAGGTAPVREMVNRTTLTQLGALLARARLLLTNDTGPMHMAVAVGTTVIDLSVGHVDFRETGPYGRGHWVVQPDLDCAPCGFDRICGHHACKDRIEVRQVADLCAHLLGCGPAPTSTTGIKLFESDVDGDGLVHYRQRGGCEDALQEWYGRWWRSYWFAEFTGRPLDRDVVIGEAPDRDIQADIFAQLDPLLRALRAHVSHLDRLARRMPIPARELQDVHRSLTGAQREITRLTEGSPAFAPLTVALRRELACDEAMSIAAMAQARGRAFRRWSERVQRVSACIGASGHEPRPGMSSRAATLCRD